MRQKSYSSGLFLLLMLGSAALPVRGAVVLLDAETDRDVAAWSHLGRVTSDRAPYLPIRGAGSARLQVSALQSTTAGRNGEVSGGRGRWLDNRFIERLWRSVKQEDIYLSSTASSC